MPLRRRTKTQPRAQFRISFFRSPYWQRVIKGIKIIILIGMIIGVGFGGYELILGLRSAIWRYGEQLTLVYEQQEQIGYIRVSPALNEITIFTLPGNAFIHLANGYQDYQASNVTELARQEQVPIGPFLQKTMTTFLGSLTSGYIVQTTRATPQFSHLILQAFFKQAQTNLSRWDLVRLGWFYIRLRPNEIKYLDFAQTGIFDSKTLPDGTVVFVANDTKLDQFALKELANPEYLASPLTWEVYNATTHGGLGDQMARSIRNSGFTVIGIRQLNQEKEQIQSELQLGKDTEFDSNLASFNRYFQFPVNRGKSVSNTADVTIVLGEEYWQWCCTAPVQ